MDVSSSLLVAVMFVIILSMGIGHILVTAAAMVDRRVARHIDALHVNWMLLLLLITPSTIVGCNVRKYRLISMYW